MYAPDPDEKFDFQNMDVKLYLALRNVLSEVSNNEHHNRNLGVVNSTAYSAAERAMHEFTQSFGPIPDWAVDHNFGYALVPGAQLCTRDGRRIGNAHIINTDIIAAGHVALPVFSCLTDAGSKFTFNEVELLEAFTIGDWISDPDRVIKDFDRNGEFKLES